MKKYEIITRIAQSGIVPVFYNHDTEIVKKAIDACYAGGIRVFEFTNRGDMAIETFREIQLHIKNNYRDMLLGAGTITDAPLASLYIQYGAKFIVSPFFDPDTAKLCNRRAIPYIPGCGTTTEISRAQEAGCDICKIFPAGELGGPEFVRNILGPMPWSLLMATGGVEPTQESLGRWKQSGITCVGMGSQLIPKALIEKEGWQAITDLCRQAVNIITDKHNLK